VLPSYWIREYDTTHKQEHGLHGRKSLFKVKEQTRGTKLKGRSFICRTNSDVMSRWSRESSHYICLVAAAAVVISTALFNLIMIQPFTPSIPFNLHSYHPNVARLLPSFFFTLSLSALGCTTSRVESYLDTSTSSKAIVMDEPAKLQPDQVPDNNAESYPDASTSSDSIGMDEPAEPQPDRVPQNIEESYPDASVLLGAIGIDESAKLQPDRVPKKNKDSYPDASASSGARRPSRNRTE
jgi:hypothetical protein